jgi:uncharacterized protein
MSATDPTPVVISVRGEANLEADPELCEFAVTIQARGPERTGVLTRLTERNNEALAQIKDTWPDALEKVQSSGFAVYPEAKGRGRGEQVKAYAGSVRIQVVVKDFTVLGDMMIRLADAEGRSVDGPYWRLRRDSAVYREARNEAVGEAISRAKEYAAAVGSQVIALLELADQGLSTSGAAQPVVRAYSAMSRPGGALGSGNGPVLDLEPVRQTVYAAVEGRFSATQPEAL